jgi:uncharacterized membrane protein HdeD (DUF308 family)
MGGWSLEIAESILNASRRWDMPDAPIARALAGHWSSLAIRGVCALIFGILSFMWPALSLATLVIIWGVYALIDGALALMVGLKAKVWSLVFIGLVGVLAGIGAFVYPGMTALVLLYFIAAWAIVTGILAIYIAIHLRKELTGEWVLALAGVLSVVFGMMLIARPGAGALAVVLLLASYAVAFGVLLLVLAFKLKALPARVAAA